MFTKLILHNLKQNKGYFRPGLANDVIGPATWQQHQQYWGAAWEQKKLLESEGQAMAGTEKAGWDHRLSARFMLVTIDKSSPMNATGSRAGSAVKMFSTA